MQTRIFNYQEDDSTFLFNIQYLGLLPPGLYRGFYFTPGAGMVLTLSHAADGLRYPKRDGSGLTPPLGVLYTRQGVIIHEDEPVTVNIQPNPSGQPRLDTLVCTHQYKDNVPGGAQAVYAVIPGNPGPAPVAPGVQNELTEVILGWLYLPAGTTSLDGPGVSYTRVTTPVFNNDTGKRTLVRSSTGNVQISQAEEGGRLTFDVNEAVQLASALGYTDWNQVAVNGAYRGLGLANAPRAAAGYYVLVHVHQLSPNAYVSQLAQGLEANEVYRRVCLDGVWQGWRRLDEHIQYRVDVNLNLVQETGRYFVADSTGNVQNLAALNFPVGNYGTLEVIASDSGRCQQVFTADTRRGGRFYRNINPNVPGQAVWSSWKALDMYPFDLGNGNLNDQFQEGNFLARLDNGALASQVNYPSVEVGTLLVVGGRLGLATQFFTGLATGNTFTRQYNGAGWSAWRPLARADEENWRLLTNNNGVSVFGRYRKDNAGWVHLKEYVPVGNEAGTTPALPVGYRPDTQELIFLPGKVTPKVGNTTETFGHVYVVFNPDGTTQYNGATAYGVYYTNAQAAFEVYVNGCFFRGV